MAPSPQYSAIESPLPAMNDYCLVRPPSEQARFPRAIRSKPSYLRATRRILPSLLLMSLGAVVALLVENRMATGKHAGVKPAVRVPNTPGVHFLSSSLFDAVGPDGLVHVCSNAVDIDIGEGVLMVGREAYPARQMQDALKVLVALEAAGLSRQPQSSRQHAWFAPAPLLPTDEADRNPVWVDVDRTPAYVDVDRDEQPDSPRD